MSKNNEGMSVDVSPSWGECVLYFNSAVAMDQQEKFKSFQNSFVKAAACASAIQEMQKNMTDEQKQMLQKHLDWFDTIKDKTIL